MSADFRPYVPADQSPPEFTLRAVLLGAALGVVFGAASVYLGLKVGLTTSASIPIAVMAIGILGKLGRSSILENNIVQTVGSAGEGLAAAVVFTLPALLFLGSDIAPTRVLLISLVGGLLGVLFTVPLRRYLIIREHGELPFPEGTACAEILKVGEQGGARARTVFVGMGVGAFVKLVVAALGLVRETPTLVMRFYRGASMSMDVAPELMGVGYILGYRIALIMVAGSALSWLILIPLITLFGSGFEQPFAPATKLIRDMSPQEIWGSYIRYIGAGAVATGGLIGLLRAAPTIWTSFTASIRQLSSERQGQVGTVPRTDRDLPMWAILGGTVVLTALVWLLPVFGINLLGAILIVIFGFFFSVVSSRITGLVGSSSCPISGMTIAALMGTCVLFRALGWTGPETAVMALSVGAVACIALSNASTMAQDLKTGYLVGATPIRQQWGLIAGALTSIIFIGWTMSFLNDNYTRILPLDAPATSASAGATPTGETRSHEGADYDLAWVAGGAALPAGHYLASRPDGELRYRVEHGIGGEEFPAPQARLMALVTSGLLARSLPWDLVLVGVAIALFMELLGINALTFAVGVYLPLSSTAPVFAGGLVRLIANKRYGRAGAEGEEDAGTLTSAGMIAGGSLMGIGVAGLVWAGVDGAVRIGPGLLGPVAESSLVALLVFAVLGGWLVWSAREPAR